MSDRIGEQILVESYKVLYDYISMNESEDAKFDLQIKTFKKIEESIRKEAYSKYDIYKKLVGDYDKLEEPIAVLLNLGKLYNFYKDNENDVLELLKMVSSNDVDGIKNAGYTRGNNGTYILEDVNSIVITANQLVYYIVGIEDDKLDQDSYKKFILKAFPVWVKSAKRLFSTGNKYLKD